MARRLPSEAIAAIVSQGLYALSNVGLTVLAALTLQPADFGVFSMAMIGFLVARGPIVAGIGHGAILDASSGPDETIARCAAGSLPFGAAFGGITLVAALVTSSLWLVVVAVGFPILLCFEVVRVAALGVGRPRLALRSDLAWLVAQAGIAAALWNGLASGSMTALAVLWVIGGAAGLATAAPQIRRCWPASGTAARLHRTLAMDDLMSVGLQRGALAAGALVVSAAAVAQTRLAIVPFNVVALAVASLQPMLLTQLRQTAGDGPQIFSIWKRHFSFAVVLTALNLVALLTASVLLGAQLGENFSAAADVLWWIALLRLSSAATLLLSSTVKAHPASITSSVLLPRLGQGLLTLILILSFGATVGWTGIAIGMSLGSLAGTGLWALGTRKLLRSTPVEPRDAERTLHPTTR